MGITLTSPEKLGIENAPNGLNLNYQIPSTLNKKDTFMTELLGFRLNNPTAFSHKAFGTDRAPNNNTSKLKDDLRIRNGYPVRKSAQGTV